MARKQKNQTRMYRVVMRRDIQQVRTAIVEARNPQEAADTAEAICGGWEFEQSIGSHAPEVSKVTTKAVQP